MIPLHLTLTGRPLMLYPAIVPELQQQLSAAYSDRAGRLADRAHRRANRKASIIPDFLRRDVEDDDLADVQGLAAAQPSARLALAPARQEARQDPYVQTITVRGPLMNRAEILGGMLCIDGYDRIEAEFAAAMSDPDCQGIFLDIDSPGGMVNGCFELTDRILAWRDEKPIVAFTDGLACSAAYSLAGACTEVHATLTATLGSIGVIYGRLDTTGADAKAGRKVTFFTSGDKKSFGYPETELSEGESEQWTAEINELGDWFHARMAQGRGLEQSAIADLEAAAFMTPTALTHGLADAQSDRAAALARLTELATAPAPEPEPKPEPAPDPTSASKDTPKKISTAAPKGSASLSTEQETPMSTLKAARNRASLFALLSCSALACATASYGATAFNATALADAVDKETDETLDAMEDDEIESMNDGEDADAMEDEGEDDAEALTEEETEAMDAADEDPDAMDDDEKTDARKASRRIAHRAMKRLAATAPKRRKSAKRSKPAASGGIDPVEARAIQNLPEAKGRETLAAELSITPGMTAETAASLLKKAEKQTGGRLAGVPNPQLGTGGNASTGKLSAGDQAQAAAAKRMRERAGARA
ncbi:S49 family peptidase [Litorimonas sp. WD9-15]|uniref:S49 family peptidase n=1 Tax=Litorimonas sp. WD9-15 TaxID=3418716 RepID=UPI003D0928D3